MSVKEEGLLGRLLAAIVFYAAMGAVVMAGMRAVEWLVPAPKRQVMVCIVDKADMTECIGLDEMPAKEKGRVML